MSGRFKTSMQGITVVKLFNFPRVKKMIFLKKKSWYFFVYSFSHGEAYLKVLQMRLGNKGVFLLGEPEAALSPLKQLSLIFLIIEILKNKNTQFIISTHSPILMGIPDAWIYEIKEESMDRVDYKDTEHYRITSTFLNDPNHYLRHL